MAGKPVVTAAASSPTLTTFAAAVKRADLTETLNKAKDITVFIPSNEAFSKVPKDKLSQLLGDKQKLTKVLNYHVVEGRKTPDDLKQGTLQTIDGGELITKNENGEITVNDAKVTCGNITTANATVYIIDKVLQPE
ncbi:hypothetical protein Ssi02_37100 [Sinosporangium siamense]|uniref:FAS1 domain-containing protein n=2 Tax=Sinosporangium siamense TaxID=1367973 RepID=A0A919RJG4_9ACTN|nr:hypothetical protein Ssi02_37100 [Sinosporangium siamense]